ncbi:hypothetical protein FRX31_014507 [Thalictrum thalictroides]|uniref:Uncharacterized protein n=1 Tax=Thalictrum thalictroides TaxID=46969 RepID=A0A7J6WEM9_THATH|nr:hypothetical protein FRX31_014507 [Thalictrum thalictroides]
MHQYRPPNPNPSYPPPSQFVASQQQPSSLEESLQKFMQVTGQAIQEVKNSTVQNTQAIVKSEHQMG